MPVIVIGNYKIPKHLVKSDPSVGLFLWRCEVRRRLWQAIQEVGVPGLEERSSVTFTFNAEWENSDDPEIAYIFLEGFEDRPDRPDEMRREMARAIGKALIALLAEGWKVEVFPKRYNSEREGAVMVSSDEAEAA